MTQGLLNSTFHDPSDGDRRRDLDQFRGQLEDAVFQEVGKIAGRIPASRQPALVQADRGWPCAGRPLSAGWP